MSILITGKQKEIIADIFGADKKIPDKLPLLETWKSWYSGKVDKFHNFKMWNGIQEVQGEKKTLQMAKYTCESWANLLLNEKCDIVLKNKQQKKLLDKILNKNEFWAEGNAGIEKAFALGYGAFVVGIDDAEVGEITGALKLDNATVKIDFVDRTQIQPITIVNKKITECAFISENSDTTALVIHALVKQKYVIYNFLIRNSDNAIINKYVFPTNDDKKWFHILKPNIVNNLRYRYKSGENDLGISVFANSIDVLEAIDNKYDGFDNEYELGRKRIFVKEAGWTTKKNADGSTTKAFDTKSTLFYHADTSPDAGAGRTEKGNPILTIDSTDLRYDAYIKGINTDLNYLSMKCGFGENYFKFDGSGISTATQVISENSTLFRNLKKHEIVLEQVLKDLIKSVVNAANTFTVEKFGDVNEEDITIRFDDSIIEDKETEMRRDKEDVNADIMTKTEYRMKWFGETEEAAREKIYNEFTYEIIDKYLSAVQNGVLPPEMFVEKVFPFIDEKTKNDLISYIDEHAIPAPPGDLSDVYSGNESGDADNESEEPTEDGEEQQQ